MKLKALDACAVGARKPSNPGAKRDKIVNLGEDADAAGAVYGQIAGAYYGEQAISDGWKRVLAKRDLIAGLADGLHAAAFR